MKTLKTLGLFLLMATGLLAQPDPSNMFISGYVLDSNGMAVDGHEVCVYWASNLPGLPPDTICATTNNNGYYFLEIVNGSVTGPNVNFIVETYDSCSFLPLTQGVSNGQGTVDLATADFTLCAVNSSCSASFTSTNDSVNGTWTFVANATGTAPFTYNWWVDGASYSTQTVSHMFNGGTVGVYLTITDANGCVSTESDTLFLNGNPNGCSVQITTTVDSNLIGLVYTLTASGGFGSYVWSNNSTTQSITVQNPSPNGEVYCVIVTDPSGCTATACDTLLPLNPNGCQASFTYPGSPNALQVGNTVQLFFDGVSSNISTYNWTISAGGLSFTATGMNPVFQIPPTLLPVNGMMVQICVTVSDSISGCSDSYCETVLAVPANSTGCQAYFVSEPDSMLGAPLPGVWFTDASQGGAFYFWDFGDNTFSTDQNPLHLYNGTGTYYVCLTITSADSSCQDTYCADVYVGNNNGNCNASFTNSGLTPIGYSFTSDIHSPNWSYYWTIDNQFVGDGYDAYSPGFTNGVHTICLTIVDSLNNCSDQQCQTITVGGNDCYGYISGEVFAGSNNQPLDEGMVYLILFDSLTNTLTAIDSLPIDSSNFFFFGPLACGDYLIKAAATSGSQYYNGHIPTYYGNSPFWGFAQTVTIGQVNAQMTTDVTLIAANNPGGPGFIGGDVTQGANKTDLGDPLSGIQVMLFNLSGDAIAYTYTDANGSFGFSNLAYGTYQVYVEALGVQTIPAIVTIGENEPSVDNVHILASESLISTGIEEFDFDGAISDVYPNPVGNDASIRINLENEVMVDISILDLAGRMISTHTISVAGGEDKVSIS
ncbi:MAG: carboxypeptidase regulatory-like domain-containing protein, partial [Flavobacteriales bacterium]|nr:carboxypeptidase regulatory-like domain-containing protein [Flavobacteriales bacterium]